MIGNGFLRNPDRYYLEEYFETLPIVNENPLLDWNYIDCSAPIFTAGGKGSDNGVFDEGTHFGVLFPGQNGEIYPGHLTLVEDFTTNGVIPILNGTIPTTDTTNGLVGLNLELDKVNTADSGCQISIGPENGNNYNKFVLGKDSGYIEATFITADWSDWDVVSIGFRRPEQIQLGHNAIISAGSGDPLYTNFATFGVQTPGKLQIATSVPGPNGGNHYIIKYKDTTNTPVNGRNLRLRVNLSTTKAVTYQYVNNAVAGGGTLVSPSDVDEFEFSVDPLNPNGPPVGQEDDRRDAVEVIPYIIISAENQQNTKLLLKDIKIYKTGIPALTNLTHINKNFSIEGTNATNSSATYESGKPGISLVTGTALGDSVIILPPSNNLQSPWNNINWGTENELEWECALSIANTSSPVWAGLKLTNSRLASTDANQIFFKTETTLNPILWNVIVTINSTTYTSQIPGILVNDKIYKLRITIDKSRFSKIYINDIQYNVNDDSTLATEVTPGPIPSKQLLDDIDLIPFIGIENDSSLGSDQRKLNVYYQKISRLLHE